MSRWLTLRSWLRTVVLRSRMNRDIDDELRFHVEEEMEAAARAGMTPDEARRAAYASLGGPPLLVREECRDQRGVSLVEDLLRDLAHGVRLLRRNVGFTVIAILTLGVGIGANTAIFSVVNGVLLRPLPYLDAEHLVRITEQQAVEDGPPGGAAQVATMNEDEFLWWRSESRTFSHLAAYGDASMIYETADGAVTLSGRRVSPALFAMLGVPPALGRTLHAADERSDAGVVVLSTAAWRRYFGARADVTDRTMTLGGQPYAVVGVMPDTFGFPAPGTDFWVPFAMQPSPTRQIRFNVLARLRDGVTLEAATAEANIIGPALRGPSAPGVPADRFRVVSMHEQLVSPVRPALRVLLVSVSLVLLIACANVASLLLGRATARAGEMAVRAAVGAGRGRLVRQLLAEGAMLALLGGAVGVLLAFGGLEVLRQLASALDRPDLGSGATTIVPRLHEVGIDGAALGYTLAVSVLTALVFGLAPSVRLSRVELRRESVAGNGRRGRSVLVAAEVALATILLVGAGLLIRSVVILVNVPSGYEPAGALTFQVPLPHERYPEGRDTAVFAEELAARLGSMPGVEAAGYADSIPTSSWWRGVPDLRRTPSPPASYGLRGRWVSRDYFRAMGTRIVEGRGFSANDGAAGPRSLVINEALARRDFGGERPVGQQVYLFGETVWQIVGVVEDVRQYGLDQEPEPAVYVDNRHSPMNRGLELGQGGWYFVARTSGDPLALVPGIRTAVAQIDPRVAPSNIATMDQLVANVLVGPRFYSTLLGIFAGVALLLSAIGIYGVVAYAVSRRTREIGVRIALGARRSAVLRLVLREALGMASVGIVLGLLGASMLTRHLEGMLFGVTTSDPITFVAVPLSFALIAGIAAYIPSLRAMSIEPQAALRCE